jgi:RNA polymerase sigma factor (sigma-70 family)
VTTDARTAEALPIAGGMARRFAGGAVPPDEARAEALYAIAIALPRFDPGRGVPWAHYARLCVRRRLLHLARRCHRDRDRRVAGGLGTEDLPGGEPADRGPAPDELAARREAARVVCRKVRRRLTARQWRALWLYFGRELPLDQVGARLGVTRQGVRCLLGRALARLGIRAGFRPRPRGPARAGAR